MTLTESDASDPVDLRTWTAIQSTADGGQPRLRLRLAGPAALLPLRLEAGLAGPLRRRTSLAIGTYAYDVEAIDLDGDDLELSLVTRPDGMTIDPASGLILWPVDASHVGTHDVTVRVEDGRGGSDEQSFTVEVLAPAAPTPAPTATATPTPTPTPEPTATPQPTVTEPARCPFGPPFEVRPNGNPWLAGMPDGSRDGSDGAPDESPTQAIGLALVPGTVLRFYETGCASVGPGGCNGTPDGNPSGLVNRSPVNGIGGVTGVPTMALMGVFLDDRQPDTWPAPDPLDFRAPPTSLGTSFTTLAPALKQPFFIGDGLTGTQTGVRQEFVVPEGATRLYVGPEDGFGWYNNSGSTVVTIEGACVDRPFAAPDVFELPVGETLDVPPPGVRANDFEPEGQAITAMLVDPPAAGELVLAADGSFTFVPPGPGALGTTRPLDAVVEWEKSVSELEPNSLGVGGPIAVADVNGDGVPDVIAVTGMSSGADVLRAVSGNGRAFTQRVSLVRGFGVTASPSSELAAGNAATRAIDGDTTTAWRTANNDAAPALEITFPGPVSVREIQLLAHPNLANTRDFATVRIRLFNILGDFVYDSGPVAAATAGGYVEHKIGYDVIGVERVALELTTTGSGSHGLAEVAVLGDGLEVGPELWTVTSPALRIAAGAGVAVCDIDLDNLPEIVTINESARLVAFDNEGALLWRGDTAGGTGRGNNGAGMHAVVVDLDGDGLPEVLPGSTRTAQTARSTGAPPRPTASPRSRTSTATASRRSWWSRRGTCTCSSTTAPSRGVR